MKSNHIVISNMLLKCIFQKKNAGFLIMVFSCKDDKLTLQLDSEKKSSFVFFKGLNITRTSPLL